MKTPKVSIQAWMLAVVLAMFLTSSLAQAQQDKVVAPAVQAAAKQAPKLVPAKPGKLVPADSTQKAPADDQAKEAASEQGPEQPAPGPAKKPGGPFGGSSFLFIMMGVLVLMFLFSSRSKKKQANKRRELLESIKKGSKIVTIGGIVGVVAEVRDDEVLIKVDDGTRMKFARWAIRTVGDEAEADKGSDTQQQR
jgi:preprotein translocase subunit YajC